MATFARITPDRFNSRDNFRLQVNLDQRLVAFLYYPMLKHFEGDAGLRNAHRALIESVLVESFADLYDKSADFRDFVPLFWYDHVDPELWEQASEYLNKAVETRRTNWRAIAPMKGFPK